MKASIILAHPNEGSFNHAIADRVMQTLNQEGIPYFYHDLYKEKFDPILSFEEIPKGAAIDERLKNYCDELTQSDAIIIIHPNWWGQPPAILKGWVDRVIRPGVAYEFMEGDKGEGIPKGLLKAQTALVFNTSNTEEEREISAFGDPLELIWKKCIFDLCGVKTVYRKNFSIVVTSNLDTRERWLEEVENIIRSVMIN